MDTILFHYVMGSGPSIEAVREKKHEYDILIGELNSLAVDLSQHYHREFLNPDFCNRVALILTDPLMEYRTHTLNGVSVALGIESPDHAGKMKICSQIVELYARRVRLIENIQTSLSFVSERIYAVTTGPICAGNPNTFDPMKCKLDGGVWQAKSVLPDPEVKENLEWYQTVSMMHKRVMFAVNRLVGVLQLMKDRSSTVDEVMLTAKEEEVKSIVDTINEEVDRLYWQTVNLKTYTKAQIEEEKAQIAASKHAQVISEQIEAARIAQLRASSGLPVVGGGAHS